MSVLKAHEWKYLKSTGKNLFLVQIDDDNPYFVHFDDGESYIEKEVFEQHLDDDGTAPDHVIQDPKLLKNTVIFEEPEEEVDLGYVLKWTR